MTEFVPGQRWVADSEPELGLGIVSETEGRTVCIFFQQGECERRYASLHAPLTRIHYGCGDEITLADERTLTVIAVHNQNGLLIYDTDINELVPETALSAHISLNQPYMRLITGQLDKPDWFFFKRQLSLANARTWQSRLNGLLGVRANLIAHQLYVARTACEHKHVRVLLADEVGLGKTIEACMILARLLKQERVHRAIIAVPDALQVQWLVELVRRFAIKPELYKDEAHDFDSGQIHIVPHSALTANNSALQTHLEGSFDIAIVDEAHHIRPSEESFQCLSDLATYCDHMILLSATPEQLGVESHFARLQLLDPSKFTDLDQYLNQEERYIALNSLIKRLPESRAEIIDRYQLNDIHTDAPDTKIVDQLLDSHGVGRVVFRNVRSAIKGFPSRKAIAHIIPDDSWEEKYEWLGLWLKQHENEKVLVICHSIEQVFECEQHLWKRHGINAAVFHEEQNMIDRDRAAAYFADLDQGSQILICSEIGSEGRNFQFSCHLVCMDLPDHPDLLEQRIGRLDRVGQTRDVNIHVPCGEGSTTHNQFNWFHQTLTCIDQQNPAAGSVHEKYWPQWKTFAGQDEAQAQSVCEQARAHLVELQAQISEGRDALLEMNSCRQPEANLLAEQIAEFEQDTPKRIVEMASELLQFHFEETLTDIYSLIPSDKMLVPALPGIPTEGAEVTFSRETANQREDLLFITWDAPFIEGLVDLLQHSELGSASLATLPSRQLPAGHCLLEVCYDVLTQSEHGTLCRPFLPNHSVRTLILDVGNTDLSATLDDKALEQSLTKVKKHIAQQIIKSKKEEIPEWFKKAEVFADKQLQETVASARSASVSFYQNEISRLERLANQSGKIAEDENIIDQSEINELKQTLIDVDQALAEKTYLQLSAIRLIIVVEPTR